MALSIMTDADSKIVENVKVVDGREVVCCCVKRIDAVDAASTDDTE